MENIGIIIKSLKGGGAERAAANLSKDLSERYNVYLMIFDSTEIAYPYKGEIIDLETVPVKGKVGKIVNFIKRYKKIYAAKRKYNFKACISFMPAANLLNVLSKYRERTICSIRNMMSIREKSRVGRYMISFTGKKADITVSLSEGVRTDLIDNFRYPPEKVKTIYNSCDISWFMVNNSNIDKIIEKTSFNGHCVVTVGRLTNQKGQWHLIKAISCVKKKIPDVQLFLFGEGELLDSLKALTEELNLSENIVFMGYVKNHHKFMAKCDCFVFPSIYEGLGNVVLEALACGIPVISTDCPYGPKEILDPNNVFEITNKHDGEYGVLVPAFQDEGMDFSLKIEKNEEILANAIIEILTDKGKKEWYRAQAIRRSIFFKPENIQHQWIDLIEEVRQ